MSETPPQHGFFEIPLNPQKPPAPDGPPLPPGAHGEPQPPYYGPPQPTFRGSPPGGSKLWLWVLLTATGAILLLGMMMAITVPAFNKASSEADRAACQDNLRRIEAAVMIYEATNMQYPRSMRDLIPNYLEEEPVCPEDGSKYVLVNNGPYGMPIVNCPNGHSY